MALVHHRAIPFFASWDALAKYELKNYWSDGCTIECRYFLSKKDAEDFAKQEGYTNYKIVLNKR